ncbi:hypothetical protein Bpfe_015039 [Biomphalaria pfeifferi]|uniref:Uncharacterized protein n=1 Tax=Biomphalaria pfeifferi TaxID=112525 RepID=A0AAD8BJ14_BIOPF|nr:hypothetical protein Bpfe_015039 [Biomphalaria pfeifferi]
MPTGQRMKLILVALVLVALASANVIRPPVVDSNREDINLAEIVTNIGNVVHVIDQFVGGTGKREEQDICATVAGVRVCLRDVENVDVASLVNNIANVVHVIDQFIGGTGKRDLENFDVTQLVNNIGSVVHLIDQFVSGTGKREQQDICATVAGVQICV